LLSPDPAQGQWQDAPVDTIAGSESDEISFPFSLDVDNENAPHAVWTAPIDSRMAVFYSHKVGDSWTEAIEAGSDGGRHTAPALAVQPGTAIPTVAFSGHLSGETDGDIYLATWNGSAFDAARLTDDDAPDGSPALAVDASGAYHVASVTQSDDLWRIRYLTNVAGEPVDLLVEGGPLGSYGSGASPAIAIDADGRAHITYRGIYGGYRVYHAFNDGPGSADWTWEVFISGNLEDYSSDIEIDATGGIHVALSGNNGWGTNPKVFYFHQPAGGSWDPYEFVPFGLGLTSPSLALDPAGGPHTAMAEVSGNFYTGRIYYARQTDDWSPVLVIGVDHGVPSLAVDQIGMGHLVCMTGPNTGIEDVLYIRSSSPVSAVERGDTIASALALRASPNPFRGTVVFNAAASPAGLGSAEGSADCTLVIFDAAGRRVKRLGSVDLAGGGFQLSWDGRDEGGVRVPSGLYTARIGSRAAAKVIKLQ
jgi:hypothetical protein